MKSSFLDHIDFCGPCQMHRSRRGLETIYTRTANASVDFSAVTSLDVTFVSSFLWWLVAGKSPIINGKFRIRFIGSTYHIFLAYFSGLNFRGYAKIWPTKTGTFTYLHVLDPGDLPLTLQDICISCSIQW